MNSQFSCCLLILLKFHFPGAELVVQSSDPAAPLEAPPLWDQKSSQCIEKVGGKNKISMLSTP